VRPVHEGLDKVSESAYMSAPQAEPGRLLRENETSCHVSLLNRTRMKLYGKSFFVRLVDRRVAGKYILNFTSERLSGGYLYPVSIGELGWTENFRKAKKSS
jgi:hypothetical protein